jgi:hypothetical protein
MMERYEEFVRRFQMSFIVNIFSVKERGEVTGDMKRCLYDKLKESTICVRNGTFDGTVFHRGTDSFEPTTKEIDINRITQGFKSIKLRELLSSGGVYDILVRDTRNEYCVESNFGKQLIYVLFPCTVYGQNECCYIEISPVNGYIAVILISRIRGTLDLNWVTCPIHACPGPIPLDLMPQEQKDRSLDYIQLELNKAMGQLRKSGYRAVFSTIRKKIDHELEMFFDMPLNCTRVRFRSDILLWRNLEKDLKDLVGRTEEYIWGPLNKYLFEHADDKKHFCLFEELRETPDTYCLLVVVSDKNWSLNHIYLWEFNANT